jgi:hypothetical protein
MKNFFKGMPAYMYNLVSNPFRCFMRIFPHLGFLGAEFSPLCRGFDNNTVPGISVYTCTLYSRGGHRHLQIGRMLDIDLTSEPPHAPSPPDVCIQSVGIRVARRAGSDSYLAGVSGCHIFVPAPHAPPPKGIGQRSKVVILPTSAVQYTVYAWALLYHRLNTFLNRAQPWSSVPPLLIGTVTVNLLIC